MPETVADASPRQPYRHAGIRIVFQAGGGTEVPAERDGGLMVDDATIAVMARAG
ncbi:hypothetical protein ACDP63_09470 [Paracoccus sp. P2]|uniref:hypothetical protein n=1 Tax=Paracoccus sp. P2 TaxID=3248840 RepID=UPI00391F39E5